jgi:hypothetical protein
MAKKSLVVCIVGKTFQMQCDAMCFVVKGAEDVGPTRLYDVNLKSGKILLVRKSVHM